jgi:tetratricopeptide (TPR) repeat protein
LSDFQAALRYPANLGEARHEVLTSEAAAHYYTGLACDAVGEPAAAQDAYERARGDAARVAIAPYYRGLACRRLGHETEAAQEFAALIAAGDRHLASPARFDYFATSLPTFLVFDDDLEKRNAVEGHYWRALGYAGMGRVQDAIAECKAVLGLDVNQLGAQALLDDLAGVA